jgi:uncharacterized caspase-like protein
VGVDHYEQMPGADLRYAKRDVQVFSDSLRSNQGKLYSTIEATTLTDAGATAETILNTLTGIIAKAEKNDLIMLSFAGHGTRGEDGKFYFLTSESTFASAGQNGLAWEEVSRILRESKAKVLVLLDACHSGGASQDIVIPNDAYASELMQTGKAGVVVLAASKGRQFSIESPALGGGHGVFSYALTQMLTSRHADTDTNGNGLIELHELYSAVKADVMQRTDGQQTPWMARNEVIGNIVLF